MSTRLRILLGCVASLAVCSAMAGAAAQRDIDIAYVGQSGSQAHKGVLQGLSEANLQGRFLGQSYTVEVFQSADAAIAAGGDWLALVSAGGRSELAKLAQRFPDRPVFNVALEDDDLRAACSNKVLHVVPSRAMRTDAVAQWRRAHPGAQVTAAAWHPDFKKYAAAQLNSRFRKARGTAMDDAAWAGWAAVKMLSDTLARNPDASPGRLLDYLREQLAFDGQKGAEMSFRDTGQLRQPLLILADGKLVGEAPVRGVVDVSDLDSLGLAHCPK